jgi:peptidyl-tRNA hydrolase
MIKNGESEKRDKIIRDNTITEIERKSTTFIILSPKN